MLAVVPLTGLVLAGCGGGGSDSGSATEQTAGVQQETKQPEEAATAESTERYDITVLMVCDAVESALPQAAEAVSAQKAAAEDSDAETTPAEKAAAEKAYQSALRKSLNSAFRTSTTPDATIADVKVDRLLNQGCPGLRAQALIKAGINELSELAAK